MIKIMLLLMAIILFGCASNKSSVESGFIEDELENKLVNFKIEVQAGRFDEAANMISLDERSKLYDGSNLKDESIRGMKLLNLSNLQRNLISLDSDDNLHGLVNAIEMAYMRSQVSLQQRKVIVPPAQEPNPEAISQSNKKDLNLEPNETNQLSNSDSPNQTDSADESTGLNESDFETE
jgi:hypothetical protein